ncbi:hypothetical protein ADN00_11710 [Ornatilinea apprima]|uniref:Undecaprenyl-diphosphatase n=1 Tax=Ornatilinea apprima TaxID=1134406 RepID=A0A0P6X8Y5_9CHLR|nr:undecaprenyl-diphosphatase UppP [Ornatilinea apprima]KPL76021.1 hypothetical protein ADN00_11710 [Ornatilinea apprima]
MTVLQSIILGFIQGLTEFLPISSSGHLVLIPHLFGWELDPDFVFIFDVLVQMGTLVAVILYYRSHLWKIASAFLNSLKTRQPFAEQDSRLGWCLILATLPGVTIALIINGVVETAFKSPLMVAGFLFLTAGLLVLSEQAGKQTRRMEQLKAVDALWIGLAQALSIFPGVSRSGATISGGMLRGLDRKDSADFSFLMSIPIMIGAGVYSLADLAQTPALFTYLPQLASGFITAAVVGYLSIAWLLRFLKKQSLKWFALYCALMGSLVLILEYATSF